MAEAAKKDETKTEAKIHGKTAKEWADLLGGIEAKDAKSIVDAMSDEQRAKLCYDAIGTTTGPSWGSALLLGIPHDVRLMKCGGSGIVHGVTNVAAKGTLVGYGSYKLASWLMS